MLNITPSKIDWQELLSNIVLKIPVRKLRKHKLLHVSFRHTNFRINSYLPRSLALLNELNNDCHIDLFCNSFKSNMTSNFVSLIQRLLCSRLCIILCFCCFIYTFKSSFLLVCDRFT